MGDRWYYWKHIGNRVLMIALWTLAFLANGGTWPEVHPFDWTKWSSLILAMVAAVWGLKVSAQGARQVAQRRAT